jgi:hypothetical protein
MKTNILFFTAVFLMFVSLCTAGTIDKPYEVGAWQGFRTAAICFTFDDNTSKQLTIIVPMFDEFNYKLTMFPVINWGPNWTSLQQAVANGHEVGSHSVTHPYLNTLSIEQQKPELENSYKTINTRIPSQKGLTIAYPYCVLGSDSLTRLYYIGGRGCQGFIERSTPTDIMNISSILCGASHSIKTAQNFNSQANSAATSKGLCVFLIHGIDNDGGYSSTESAVLRTHLEYLKANDDKFWVATFGNIVRYIKERNAVSVTETSVIDSVITLTVTDTLDNTIYNAPITIRRPMPEGWPSASVTQNGQPITPKFIDKSGVIYLMFDIAPDAGDIIISKSAATSVDESEAPIPSAPSLSQNYPNPFNPETEIRFQLPERSHVELKIVNSQGQEISTLANTYFDAGNYIVRWNGTDTSGKNVASGIYFYRLKADDHFDVKRMIVLR